MRRLIPVWIFLGLFLAGLIYLPGVSKYLKLKQREIHLDEEIVRLEAEISSLKEKKDLLRSDVTRLEEVVREELGLVRPNEVVYKVVEEEITEEEAGHLQVRV